MFGHIRGIIKEKFNPSAENKEEEKPRKRMATIVDYNPMDDFEELKEELNDMPNN